MVTTTARRRQYVSPRRPARRHRQIFRFFGDSNGDGAVAANDFTGFKGAFGAVLTASNEFFDYNGATA